MTRRSSVEMENVAPETRSNAITAIAGSEEWNLPAEQEAFRQECGRIAEVQELAGKASGLFSQLHVGKHHGLPGHSACEEGRIEEAQRSLRRYRKLRDRRELPKELTIFSRRRVGQIIEVPRLQTQKSDSG